MIVQKQTWSLGLLCLLAVAFSINADTCSYENCPKWQPDMLNVHLVCHTHDDAGWLKTIDQYFWGANQSISRAAVQYILDSVTDELENDPKKRFSYAESSFFWRWWKNQDDATRHQVQRLVRNGQLEFIGGGWVQNDEATSHYTSIIDQMTIGHRFLNVTFGRCGIPKVAWQIDPFGHSREVASLFAQMGLEGLFFARLHYSDRDKRLSEKSMEMLWRGSDDLGASSQIFTHAFFEHYMPPPGFCFDEDCDDEPIMDDIQLDGYNVDKRVDDFLKYVTKQAEKYQSNHILLTMGGDFQYRNAAKWFANLDKLIRYTNARQARGSKINLLYSTPTCYMKATKEAGMSLQTKTDDFFPYATAAHSYWTGYFSSRPSLKGAIRSGNNLFQACQAMDALGDLGPADFGDVDVMHRALGVLQHHDAVTGTAKQHVTNDYLKMLHEGVMECQQVFNDALSKVALKTGSSTPPPYQTLCNNLNVSICNVTQTQNQFIITLFNAMSDRLNTYLRVPVAGTSWTVNDPDGQRVSWQIIPTFISGQIKEGKQGPNDLVFPVSIPGLGYSTYYVSKASTSANLCADGSTSVDCETNGRRRKTHRNRSPDQTDSTLQNDFIKLEFDSSTGLLSSITDRTTGHTQPLKQDFLWYAGAKRMTDSGQATGAYIFRPNGTTPIRVATKKVELNKIEGELVQEIRQTFSPWLTQTIRLFKDKPYVEFEWTVGPVPFQDNISKEIVTRFESQIRNQGAFFTDSNGRQLMQRQRNKQSTYEYDDSEPVAANYYPITSMITIKDQQLQLSILNDRAQGGSSLTDGAVELMVHRRCFEDDGFGVEEALNETGIDGQGLVVRGKHWLVLSQPEKAPRFYRRLAQEMFYQPVGVFSPLSTSFEDYGSHFKTSFHGLKNDLPENVNVLTVSQWHAEELLIRLEHLYQKNEDAELAKPVTVNLKELFAGFQVESVMETTLSANRQLEGSIDPTSITLNPMQIRTFRCQVSERPSRNRNRVHMRFPSRRHRPVQSDRYNL